MERLWLLALIGIFFLIGATTLIGALIIAASWVYPSLPNGISEEEYERQRRERNER